MTDDDGWWRMELWGGGVTGAGRWQRIYLTTERLNHFIYFFFNGFWTTALTEENTKEYLPLSDLWFIFGRRASSFATDSEIRNHFCDRTTHTHTHTHTHRCALHCSIPMKNVIYSYLFITEKATLRCPVKVEGIPPPFTHTHSRTGQNKRFEL